MNAAGESVSDRMAGVARRLGAIQVAPRLSLFELARQVFRESFEDHIDAYAGNITYNAFLSIFPFLLFLLSLLRLVRSTSQISALVSTAVRALPVAAAATVHRILQVVIALLPHNVFFSVLLACGSLWAVSAASRAVMEAMSVMDEVKDERSLPIQVAVSMMLSLATALLWLGALILIVAGADIAAVVAVAFGRSAVIGPAVTILQWLVLLTFTWLAFALTYKYAPARRQPARALAPGATIASAAWLIFSAVFAFVLNHFGRFLVSPLYGWFTGLIVLLIYLYWSSYIVLVGAEINRVLARRRTRAS